MAAVFRSGVLLLMLVFGLFLISCCHAFLTGGNNNGGNCQSTTDISEELFANDVNKFIENTEFRVNYQAKVKSGQDKAPDNLIEVLNTDKLNQGTYALLQALFDNYDRTRGHAEDDTPQELREQRLFLDAVLETPVFEIFLNYSICRGWASDVTSLRARLQEAWFDGYARSGSSPLDSSGFEHVMVGEYSSSKVGGYHNWVSFYDQEQAGAMDYGGYIKKVFPHIITCTFKWNGKKKPTGGFMIGTSPEFDLALYSLAFFNNPQGVTKVSLGGNEVRVQTYDKNGHVASSFILS